MKHKLFSVDARNAAAGSYMCRVAGTGVKESLGDAAYEPPLVLLDEPLESLQGREQIDFIADYAAPLPTLVILEMMGLPLEHCTEFKQWSEEILWGYNPDRDRATQNRLRDAYIGMSTVFRNALEQRRQAAGDDLISALARARAADNGLTELQVISLCTQLMVAGNVTTTDLIGNGL